MDRLVANQAALYTVKTQTKVQASVFEAYIAGVFYDFLVSEIPGGYDEDDRSIVVTVDGESTRDDASMFAMSVDEVGNKNARQACLFPQRAADIRPRTRRTATRRSTMGTWTRPMATGHHQRMASAAAAH